MKPGISNKETRQPIIFYRIAYLMFLILVAYYLFRGDIENATINLGIALVFDPFDPAVPWSNRPVYQRVWLITHLVILLAGFGFMIFR